MRLSYLRIPPRITDFTVFAECAPEVRENTLRSLDLLSLVRLIWSLLFNQVCQWALFCQVLFMPTLVIG